MKVILFYLFASKGIKLSVLIRDTYSCYYATRQFHWKFFSQR